MRERMTPHKTLEECVPFHKRRVMESALWPHLETVTMCCTVCGRLFGWMRAKPNAPA